MDLVHKLCPLQLLEVTKKSDIWAGWLASNTTFGSYTIIIMLSVSKIIWRAAELFYWTCESLFWQSRVAWWLDSYIYAMILLVVTGNLYFWADFCLFLLSLEPLNVSSGYDALSSVFMIVLRDCFRKMGGDFQLSVDLKVVFKK